MARQPSKPWFRSDRNAWFVCFRGKQVNLGPDKKEAERRFHELMAKPDAPPTTQSQQGLSIAEVFEKFLDWCQKHRASRTYDWYRDHINSFLGTIRHPDQMAISALKPYHVMEWADAHPDWGNCWRRGAIIAIQRPFNWADKLGYIPTNPIKHIEKPQADRREQVVTPEEWPTIRDHYPDGDAFRDLLEFLWETGCRPQEARLVEARHVYLDKHCVIFPKEEAKGKRRVRVIHLTDRAEAILRRRVGEGLVFRNAKGRPWTAFAFNCRFQRLKKHLGIKYACYSVRHGFGTRKLEEGLDHITVAALMGHKDATMLAQVYSHVGERQDYLREKLNGSDV